MYCRRPPESSVPTGARLSFAGSDPTKGVVIPSWLKPRIDWLLVFLPVTLAAEWFASDAHVLIFVTSCLSIIPLAAWMGHATEHLAERTGEGSAAC